MQETYNVVQAATRLRVTKMTVIRWCRSGKLTGAYKLNYSRRLGWQIPAPAIEQLLKDRYDVAI